MLSPLGMIILLLVRIFLGSLCLCSGIHMFDFKKLMPFFSWRRVTGLCLVTIGLRLLVDAILFFSLT